jgi:voltage-gated potassium channel
MLALCLYALGTLAVQVAVQLEPGTRDILDYADYAVCMLFLGAISFVRAPDRWRYLVTWGWLDLLSSVPALDFARWGRAARMVRIFRVLRGLWATRIVAQTVLLRRRENTFLAASLVAILT